jgi:hypothetical protein
MVSRVTSAVEWRWRILAIRAELPPSKCAFSPLSMTGSAVLGKQYATAAYVLLLVPPSWCCQCLRVCWGCNLGVRL